MDDMKLKLSESVATRLSAAPASKEKDELIEELSDNLYRRFLEMTGAGLPDEEAFTRALDDLGDVDELLSYLGVEPGGVTIDQAGSQTRITTKSGKTVITNNPGGDEPITINSGDSHPITINPDEPEEMKAARLAAEAQRIQDEAEAAGAPKASGTSMATRTTTTPARTTWTPSWPTWARSAGWPWTR